MREAFYDANEKSVASAAFFTAKLGETLGTTRLLLELDDQRSQLLQYLQLEPKSLQKIVFQEIDT